MKTKRRCHKKRKLFVLGLDGATWDVLLPLIEEGWMPTLKAIMEKGAWGDLESIIPPVTGPSWTSFATGKNPGKTGVFDYFVREPNKYILKPISSVHLKDSTFWDFLSSVGYRVGIVAFPMLYPPYEINGFMLSGAMAPSESNICFPPELRRKLVQKFGPLETSVKYHDQKYEDEEFFLEELNNFVDKQKEIVKHLMKENRWDLFLYIFSATDWIQHLMWKHIDSTHPLYDPIKSPHLSQRFNEFFRKIDSSIKEILDLLNTNTNVIILSDHGFGINDQCFNLTKWLAEKGYLAKISLPTRIKIEMKKNILRFLGPINKNLKISKLFSKATIQRVSKNLESNTAEFINFKKSKAYCLGHTIPFGAIYINLKGRDLEGVVDVKEYELLRNEIIEKFHDLPNEVGDNLKVKVFDSKEENNCKTTNSAPDILFTINNFRCVILESDFSRPLLEKKSFSNRHTGSHRMNGIFIAYGSDIKRYSGRLTN